MNKFMRLVAGKNSTKSEAHILFVFAFLVILLALALPHAQAQAPTSTAATLTLEDLQQIALENNPTLAQSAANIRSAEARKKQSGLYPNPTVGYQGEQIRGGSQGGGEQGFFIQQNIVLGGKLGLNRKIFEQEKQQAQAEADEQKLRVLSNVRMSYVQALAAQETLELRRNLSKLAQDAVETSHQLANVGQADADNPVAALTRGELQAILLGERQTWGGKVPIVLMMRTYGSPEREIVVQKICRMNQAEYHQYWNTKIFRGEASVEPVTLPSVGAALNFVSSVKGGLSFVTAGSVSAKFNVKIVRIDGHLPGEPYYPLQ